MYINFSYTMTKRHNRHAKIDLNNFSAFPPGDGAVRTADMESAEEMEEMWAAGRKGEGKTGRRKQGATR